MRLVLAGVLVLGVLLVLTGCSGGKPAASAGGDSDASKAATQSDTGSDSSAPQVDPTPMGNAAMTAGWTITVTGSQRVAAAGGAKAEAGHELLVITFTLQNGNKTGSGIGPSSFKLRDSSGTLYQPAVTNDKTFIYNIGMPIKAGETRTINIAYSVPTGASGLIWTYTPFSENGQATPVALEVQ